jgi:radical SAM superfamily enzyme YgiQ (UPF0313 family)
MVGGNIDVLLVIPNPYNTKGINETTNEQNLGVLYIGTVLKVNGFRVKILDAKVLGLKNKEILNKVKECRPRLIGITMPSISYRVVKDLCTGIRELDRSIKILLGGAHPTSLPKETLEDFDVDAVVKGEGEFAVLEIANNIKNNRTPFKNVQGVAYKYEKDICWNLSRPIKMDINSYPFPDYSLLPPFKLYKRRTKRNPAVPILTSRGCPFKCTFCSKDVYKQIFLPRSPENVLAEIHYLVNQLAVKQIDIIDDNFLVDRKRAKQILEKIVEYEFNLSIYLQSGIRVNSIDEDMTLLMKKAGVYRVAFGIETGDNAILKTIKKEINIDEIKKAVSYIRKAGLRIDCFFMIGLPGDDPTSMQKTIDLAKELNPNTATFSMVLPFPGTELYQQVKREGKLYTDARYGVDAGYYMTKVNYILPGMKEKEILKFFKKAYREFYLRPHHIWEMIMDVKSFHELNWLISTGINIGKNILLKAR